MHLRLAFIAVFMSIVGVSAAAHADVTASTSGYDFNYDVSGVNRPSAVFDDGFHVYFQFRTTIPHLHIVCADDGSDLPAKIIGPYVRVNRLCARYNLSGDGMHSEAAYIGAWRMHARQAAPPPLGAIAAAQDKNAFIPLRRVSANGAPVAVRSRLYRLHNVPLPVALDAIVPSTMDAEIDHDAKLSGIRVSVTGRRQWTSALEKAMVQSGLYARVDWDSRKIYISHSYFAVIAADRMRTANRRVTLRAGSGDHASEAAYVLPGHRKSQFAGDGYRKIADADFNRIVAGADKESGGAAKLAAIAVAPSSPSVVKTPAAPAVASPPLKTGAAVLPPAKKKKSSIKPVDTAVLSGKSKGIGKEKTKSGAIRLIRGEMLSEAIRRYAATAGYAVLWNVNYHLRIERNVTIPPPPTFRQGLSIMLRPAGGLKADSYGHKLIVITDKDR